MCKAQPWVHMSNAFELLVHVVGVFVYGGKKTARHARAVLITASVRLWFCLSRRHGLWISSAEAATCYYGPDLK